MDTFFKLVTLTGAACEPVSHTIGPEVPTAAIMNSSGLLSHVVDRPKVNRRFGERGHFHIRG
jgi:hypothetical protein